MATRETAFSLEIIVSAVLTHEDGTTEDVDDIKTLQKQFKDYQVVQKFLCNETYFHLQGVCTTKDELLLKCYVLSDSELTDLEEAIASDHLGQELTKYVISVGLETELGLPHDSGNTLSLELELRKQYIRHGRAYFKKISKPSEKDGKTSSSKKKGGKSDDRDQPLDDASPSISKQDEKNPISKKERGKGNEPNASKSGTLPLVGDKNGKERKDTNDSNGAGEGKCLPADVDTTTPDDGGSKTVATTETVTSVSDKTSTEATGPDLESQSGSVDKENQNTQTAKSLARSDETGKRKDQSQSEFSHDEHLSGSNTKRKKVEDGSTALKPEDTGQRATPESITKGVKEPVLLKKEVLLYIPASEMKKKHMKNVFAEFTSKVGGDYGWVKMRSLDENMWTSGKVDFHPNVDEYLCGITIHHCNTWLSVTKKNMYKWRAMGTNSIFRCIEGLCDYEEGFCGHVSHILMNISAYGYKDALMQIEDLTRNIFKDHRDIESIFRLMKKCFEHGIHSMSPDSLSALGYVYSKLSMNQDYIKHSQWATPTICQSILKGFKAISVKDIPSTMMSAFRRIAESLCQVAFPKSPCHFFTVLEYCFHLFSSEYFSKLLQKSISTNTFKVHDIEHVRSVLRGTYSLVSTDDEPSYCQFLERLLQHFPLEFALAEEENVSFLKTDTQTIIHMKVENECSSLMKTRNIVQMVKLHEVLSKWEKVKGDIARCMEQKVIWYV
ncbi:uncharacterized protein LOC124272568 isoform X2 [Haliotis rubra]|uniref:uncharacterized protein LOC124272568 isoform X2 n=1 Tax=Haliotis rubra TaxID=36100 RepID=UPI001EE4EBFC|nr:uncharacterized protein LOC124272568 isoform X2 [Haliotis rubra]